MKKHYYTITLPGGKTFDLYAYQKYNVAEAMRLGSVLVFDGTLADDMFDTDERQPVAVNFANVAMAVGA